LDKSFLPFWCMFYFHKYQFKLCSYIIQLHILTDTCAELATPEV